MMRRTIQTLILGIVGLALTFSLRGQITPNSSTRPSASSGLPTVSYGTTDKVNYVRTYAFYKAMTGTTGLSTEISNNNVMQASQYFDGLGRPVQTVTRKGSGNAKDLVSFMVYDAYGRQVFQPMPYVATGSTDGAMQLNPTSSQSSFLNGHYSGEDIFYGKTDYEASPLNRPLKQMAPGNSWAGSARGLSTAYLTNTSGEGVRLWSLGSPPTSTTYAAGDLMKMVTTDENGNQVKEYTDKLGRVVLKQVQKGSSTAAAHSNWLNTYYLYDDYGNLTYVLPPRAVEVFEAASSSWNTSAMNPLIFQYSYDGRNRMITKQVPGAGVVSMVYDKLDRLVLTQDANQAIIDQWTFTKYDAFSRPIFTGFITSSASRATLQATADSWTGEMHVSREALVTEGVEEVLNGSTMSVSHRNTDIDIYRTKSTGYIDYLSGFESATSDEFETELTLSMSYDYTAIQGYHDATFPLLKDYESSYEINTINYYDDYDFTAKSWSTDYSGFYTTGQELINYNFVTPAQHTEVTGLATGSKVRILGSEDFLTTVMFYDDRGRVIQTQGDNHLGGVDITTTQYDFAGRVLHTYTKHSNPEATANSTTRILKEFAYDHAGRLITIKEKLNDTGSLKTLVTNSYNELGELATKKLGDATSPLETLDYDYNVRGWLKSINGDELANHNAMTSHYFAMDLSYDYGFTQNQYNGNIAGVKWKTKSSDQIRAYGFDYDPVNRLTVADYTQGSGWGQSVADFSTGYGYDANGNILKLLRKGTVAGTITSLDSLSYNYGGGFTNAGGSNQLLAVKDSRGDLGQGDFIDGNTSGDDYSYDANGNMKDDLNKDITNITYNHLNLPETVTFSGSRSITYTYDAAGIKLQKVANDNGTLTTTDYVAGFIYENDELQHFAHEEGRVRKNSGGSLVYDYFIKDHLGNTRMTLTEATEVTIYQATMEVGVNSSGEQVDAYEESVFLFVDQVRDNSVPAANTTDVAGITDEYTARLNGTVSSRRVGPGKMLAVSAGDQVDVSVDSYYGTGYSDSGDQGQTAMINAIAALFGGLNGGTVQEDAVFDLFNETSVAPVAFVGNRGSSSSPRAYLNVLVFDQDFNIVTTKSAFKQTTQQSQTLSHTVSLDEGGFIYIYLSNESVSNFEVHFDDLNITHTKGAILQEDHYYPFGMSISALSSSAPLSKPNRFKYNGKELNEEFDLNWYSYGAREYDPQMGRFFNIDFFAEDFPDRSPYHYANNNPALNIDVNGDSTFVTMNDSGSYNVVGGNLDGDDNGIYIQNADGTIGDLVGYSATPESFYISEEGKWLGTIDPNDQSGRDFLNNDILKDNPNIAQYMFNATKGEKYDFKRTSGTDKPVYDSQEEFYRGMPILDGKNGKPIFASARDVGNIAAGLVAGRDGIGWDSARLILDGLESYQKGEIRRESTSTQYAQKLGHRIGSQIYLKTKASRLPGNGHLRSIKISKDVIKKGDL